MNIKNNVYVVYKHTTPNNKYYIGITSKKPNERWEYGQGYKGQYFYEAIQEFGWDNIKHKILIHGLTKTQALKWETKLIKYYKSDKEEYGYNKVISNEYGTIEHSEETRKLISKNNARWFLGKNLSEKTKQRISKSHNKNKKAIRCIETQIIYESINEASRQTGVSKYHIISVCKGRRKTCGGYRWEYVNKSDINTKKYTQTCGRSVVCIETGIKYPSIMEASRQTGINRTQISSCVRNKCFTAGTFRWVYGDNIKNNRITIKTKKIVCLENLKVYNDANQAYKFLDIAPENIRNICRRKNKSKNGISFRYLTDFIKEYPEDVDKLIYL